MRICHSCGAEVQDDFRHCTRCGTELSAAEAITVKDRLFAFFKAYICTLFFKAFTYAAIIVTVIVCTAAGVLLFGSYDSVYEWCQSPDGSSILTAITYLLFIGVLICIITLRRRPLKAELGIRRVPFISLPLAALFGYSGNLIYMTAMNLIPWPKWIIESHMDAYGDIGADGSSLILTMVVTAVMTGIIEEIVFRGLVIPRLRRAFSPVATLIISGAFFGAAHPTLFAFCYSFILGIFLGAVYLRFNSVLPCIVLHTFFNLAACIGYPESTMFFLIAVPVCIVVHAASGTILLKTNCLMDSNKNHRN